MSFLEREARGQKDKDVKALVRDLQKLLRKHYAVINAVFTYYAIVGGGSPYTMELNDFTSLLETCNVPDKESELCKKSDCDTVFIQCNFQARGEGMGCGGGRGGSGVRMVEVAGWVWCRWQWG